LIWCAERAGQYVEARRAVGMRPSVRELIDHAEPFLWGDTAQAFQLFTEARFWRPVLGLLVDVLPAYCRGLREEGIVSSEPIVAAPDSDASIALSNLHADGPARTLAIGRLHDDRIWLSLLNRDWDRTEQQLA
jgi:hypothetical protein